jgi:hypothetical protein
MAYLLNCVILDVILISAYDILIISTKYYAISCNLEYFLVLTSVCSCESTVKLRNINIFTRTVHETLDSNIP